MEDKGKAARSTGGDDAGKVRVIASTKRGDRGQTSLLSGERVSKANPRIEACGNVDELNAAMGLAKAFTRNEKIRDIITHIQKHLIMVGAELSSTDPGRYSKRIEQDHISQLEEWIEDLQMEVPLSRSFVDPGSNPVGAALDLARAIERRAERSIVPLQETGDLGQTEVLSYMNRLGFLLFTLARYADKLG